MDLREQPLAMAGIAVGLGLVIGLGVFFLLGTDEEPVVAPEPVVEAPPPAPPPPLPPLPDPEPFEVPPLDESDAVIRDLIAALSGHPGLAAWLVSDDLIRMFVVVVDNVANGNNPAQRLPFLRPDRRFQTAGSGSDLHIAEQSYDRYDDVIQIVASLDTAGTAQLYRQLLPLMDEAYAELGNPAPFATTFRRAVVRILETPVIEGQPELVARAALYEYTDQTLQRLSPIEKQLMGMGPDNLRTLQDTIRDIATAIGVTDLPRGQVLLR